MHLQAPEGTSRTVSALASCLAEAEIASAASASEPTPQVVSPLDLSAPGSDDLPPEGGIRTPDCSPMRQHRERAASRFPFRQLVSSSTAARNVTKEGPAFSTVTGEPSEGAHGTHVATPQDITPSSHVEKLEGDVSPISDYFHTSEQQPRPSKATRKEPRRREQQLQRRQAQGATEISSLKQNSRAVTPGEPREQRAREQKVGRSFSYIYDSPYSGWENQHQQ